MKETEENTNKWKDNELEELISLKYPSYPKASTDLM